MYHYKLHSHMVSEAKRRGEIHRAIFLQGRAMNEYLQHRFVYVCVCVHVCVRMCVCMCVFNYVSVYVCMCV